MDINEKAPGNISQGGASSGTDNETGFDHLRDKAQRSLADEEIDQLEGHDLVEPREPGIEVPPDTESETPLPRDDEAPIDESSPDDDVNEGLTDDERVSRETDAEGDGARVTPGPADEERLSK